jgi:signal transduction histidine kinase
VAFVAFALALAADHGADTAPGLPAPPAGSDRRRFAGVALLALLAPLATGSTPWPGPPWTLLARAGDPWPLAWLPGPWHAALWGLGAVLLARAPAPALVGSDLPPGGRARLQRARRRLRLAMVAVVAAIGALVLVDRGVGRAMVVVPLCSAAVQLLLLVGVLRFQLYGTARRAERAGAARAGALAGDAAELERLALLGEIGATVAHEVRNPLTGIRSLAQRLGGEEVLSPERRARFATLIVGEVDRLDRFVGGLLALARRDAHGSPPGEPAHTEAVALLDDLAALVAARAERSGVRLALAAEVGAVAAPRGPLAQILLNLLLNAVAHSPAGGTVHVRVHADAAATHCTVRDEGPGLPPDADALFAPFTPGARGTGLGLAIARRVADARGWSVAGANAPGGGACFTLTVPAAPRDLPAADATDRAAAPAGR